MKLAHFERLIKHLKYHILLLLVYKQGLLTHSNLNYKTNNHYILQHQDHVHIRGMVRTHEISIVCL